MKIGIVGYAGSGKSTLFELLTGEEANPANAHTGQAAMAVLPEPRLDQLQELYQAKKITRASLELMDTPGLSRDQEDNAQRLATLRESGCLVLVVAGFSGSDPLEELASFEEDLLFADLDLVTRRVEKLQDLVKKPRPNQEQDKEDLEALLPIQAHLEQGKMLREMELNENQIRATRSFQLLTEKPKFIIVNTADDEAKPERFTEKSTDSAPIYAAPLGIELELMRMPQDEREVFQEEMGIETFSRDPLLQGILKISGKMLFFTAGEKEVRTWLINRGDTAQEAAGAIHTDLARGFIRADVMNVDDLLRVGSEREMKAQNLLHKEQKGYIVQEGDVLLIYAST
ncbi:GTP-binding and nucleic acid-binding protein YchF [Planctomycetales bacterium 10988]|nr:GTP-binding and nucleic acid-binding protein YchF [Planctomycetales bacterium 10988]